MELQGPGRDRGAGGDPFAPLAARMRPADLSEFLGQGHLLGPAGPITGMIRAGKVHSMILWGPPGTGKTTLAWLLARKAAAHFLELSAVASGVKEIRAAVADARRLKQEGQPTILFIDEVHRFNKGQQDALLPYVEDGTVTLIGATTENPSFELVGALLSRARVYVLKPLSQADLRTLIDRALADPDRGFGKMRIDFPEELRDLLAQAADGDGRRGLNFLDLMVQMGSQSDGSVTIGRALLEAAMGRSLRRFDKGGEAFYDEISALHKSVRGSDPDGALYWLARMLDGGADPLYVARRLVRMATEDVGNADPRALRLALDAKEAYDFLGSPEGELALAQATVYLACAPKSNAAYVAWKGAQETVGAFGSLEVPMHLRNAPTRLMKSLGYGRGYRYDHDFPDGVAPGQCYLPEAIADRIFYQPTDRGLEARIQERLAWIRARHAQTDT